MTVSELSRTPAVDGVSNELLSADKEPEADEDDDGVLTTQSIYVVVVDTEFYLANAQHRFEQLLHAGNEIKTGSSTRLTDRRRCYSTAAPPLSPAR